MGSRAEHVFAVIHNIVLGLLDVVFPRGIFHLGAWPLGLTLGLVGELSGPEIGNSQCGF